MQDDTPAIMGIAGFTLAQYLLKHMLDAQLLSPANARRLINEAADACDQTLRASGIPDTPGAAAVIHDLRYSLGLD